MLRESKWLIRRFGLICFIRVLLVGTVLEFIDGDVDLVLLKDILKHDFDLLPI